MAMHIWSAELLCGPLLQDRYAAAGRRRLVSEAASASMPGWAALSLKFSRTYLRRKAEAAAPPEVPRMARPGAG
jgi:hypothetical protein